MSSLHICGNEERLVAHLYDEAEPAERAAVEAHLERCPRCREEMAALRDVRGMLSSWSPPQMVSGGPSASNRRWTSRAAAWNRWPAVATAAAAVLVLAAAAAIANLQIHYGPDGLTIRTGWASTAD